MIEGVDLAGLIDPPARVDAPVLVLFQGLGFRVQGLGFRVLGFGCRVSGFRG